MRDGYTPKYETAEGCLWRGWWEEGLAARELCLTLRLRICRRKQILTSFPGRQRETLETTTLYFFQERAVWFDLCSSSRAPPRVYFHFLSFLILTCVISDCVRIRDKNRASFIAPGFGAGTSISIETSTLIDPGPFKWYIRVAGNTSELWSF